MDKITVVIPTRNRPGKLDKCLNALGEARENLDFDVAVCDSSTTEEVFEQVKEVCLKYSFACLHRHSGKNVAEARNFCAEVATGNLIVNVDDDIYVKHDAILRLYQKYKSGSGWRVVGGSVAWGDDWSTPVVMRPIGYGRGALPGEKPSFIIGAFFIYSKKLALALPWNTRIRTSDDRFMGAVWRSNGVSLEFEPEAKAFHDHQHTYYGVEHQESHIYSNLFDALIANRSLTRALSYEFLGFAAGARLYSKNAGLFISFVQHWCKGHYKLIRDWKFLRTYRSQLPHL